MIHFYLIRGNNAERKEGPQTFVRDNALNVCMSLVSCLLVIFVVNVEKATDTKGEEPKVNDQILHAENQIGCLYFLEI